MDTAARGDVTHDHHPKSDLTECHDELWRDVRGGSTLRQLPSDSQDGSSGACLRGLVHQELCAVHGGTDDTTQAEGGGSSDGVRVVGAVGGDVGRSAATGSGIQLVGACGGKFAGGCFEALSDTDEPSGQVQGDGLLWRGGCMRVGDESERQALPSVYGWRLQQHASRSKRECRTEREHPEFSGGGCV